ncbi:MFS transporter [Sphingobium jiangsuense]|uniref:MFS family permease n=1 Tax=Sphingobium jiangsuense TaxID=870476 RepID=A0A7W6BFJ4_9SPHN|nr:MFS transporter [Sphingobium jiangsuense]MBB3925983.1 MFS family permease [Sphingobium jiangsuense]GLS98916.1 MFS transporter [Sphingobium jiangsuense]
MTAAPAGRTIASPLDDAPMRPRQVMVLAVSILLAALDGYDALAMAFAAPAVAREWNLEKDIIGLLLSSSLAGMAIGAIALSPLADIVGRRKVVLGALLLLTMGTALSGISASVPLLAGSRVLTGIGIGVMVAMTTLISAEFTNARFRSLAIAAIATIGFPIGGVVGGVAASAILKGATWHWVFLTGSISGGILFLLAAFILPESPAFLIARRTPDALQRVNRVLLAIGQAPLQELPAATAGAQRGSYRSLFAPGPRAVVLRLASVAMLIAISSYYILNWLPQMVVDAGFTPAQGSMVSAQSGMLGLLGGIGFAAFSFRFAPTRIAAVSMTGAALGLAAVGLVPPAIPLFVLSAGILGFCLAGTTGMLYAIMADSFPAAMRASGIGFAMGAARIASVIGPALAGVLFSHGWSRAEVSLAFAIGPLMAALLIGTFRHRPSGSQ